MLRSWLIALGLTLTASTQAAEVPGPLVDPDWVAENRDAVAVVDIRGDPETFAEGEHIPDAALARWGAIRTEQEADGVRLRKMLPSRDTFRDRVRGWGVDAGEAVVITSPGDTAGHVAHMARLYWQLKYYGHDNVALLDGGNAAWRAADQTLKGGDTRPQRGNWQVTAQRDALLADTADVAEIVAEGGAQLVDSRPLRFYLGLEHKSYVGAPGHIPGARLMPFLDTVTRKGDAGMQFRSAGELRDFASAMGIDPEEPVVTYCNSGNVNTVSWLVFHEILDNPDTSAYDGSMHAWTKDPERPTVTMELE